MKRALRIAVILLAVSLTGIAFMLGSYISLVQRFPADPANGYFADFYLYISPQAKRAAREDYYRILLTNFAAHARKWYANKYSK